MVQLPYNTGSTVPILNPVVNTLTFGYIIYNVVHQGRHNQNSRYNSQITTYWKQYCHMLFPSLAKE